MGRIDIQQLTKRFGSTVAVEDLTLSVADSEFLVLVGPSGCGKSTTLRCLAGLESPSEGDIYIDGEHMNYKTSQNRDIAMVFQDYALYPHMSVHGNIRFGVEEDAEFKPRTQDRFERLANRLGVSDDGLASAGDRIEGLARRVGAGDAVARRRGRKSWAAMDERVEETAELLGIADLLDRRPDELSGGQQQRVALGRAIVREPEAFLMDEPLANLDAKLRSEMRAELQQLQEQLDVTTVYVTHNQTEAMTMGDRIAVMRDGHLQQVGEPLELYHAPANEFVAGFIGEPMMNLLSGRREDGRFVGEHLEYRLDGDMKAATADATELTLGVRPEDVTVATPDEAPASSPGAHQFRMEVSVVEPHGDQNVVHLYPADSDEGSAGTAATDGEPAPETNGESAPGADGESTPGTDRQRTAERETEPEREVRADGERAEARRARDVLQAVIPGMQLVGQDETVIVTISPDVVHFFDGQSGDALHNRRLEPETEVTEV